MCSMSLYDAASDVEGVLGFLEEDILALKLLYDDLETDGWQHPDNPLDETKAVFFVRKFPSLHATFRIILEEFELRIQNLRKITDNIYEAAGEKEGE